ncbi:MAG: sialate O-acetylesterase [Akkermansiaceae bacterium]|nr:sialate O-acetylesterase [Akkermansiaceae bacterium]
MKALHTILAASLAMTHVGMAQEDGKHLFILSGQSNMFHMKPSENFVPAVQKAFGKENIIIASTSKRGAPIRNWDKDYVWPEGRSIPQGRARPGKEKKTREQFVGNFGNLYDKLWNSIEKNTAGKSVKTVTLVWMQGESDSGPEGVKQYFESFDRVVARLKGDLGVNSINIVIGRLSDYGLERKQKESWSKLRDLQVQYCEQRDHCEWVNTDDLNDGSRGNDLHYTKEGYDLLGQRFAEKAIALIKKQQAAN